MSKEQDIARDFDHHSREFFSDRVHYKAATALLLYWEKNDVQPEDEVDALRHLFEYELGYSTVTLKLPMDSAKAQLELNREVATFTARYSAQVDTLIVIYYAGHCEPDENGKAQWAA